MRREEVQNAILKTLAVRGKQRKRFEVICSGSSTLPYTSRPTRIGYCLSNFQFWWIALFFTCDDTPSQCRDRRGHGELSRVRSSPQKEQKGHRHMPKKFYPPDVVEQAN